MQFVVYWDVDTKKVAHGVLLERSVLREDGTEGAVGSYSELNNQNIFEMRKNDPKCFDKILAVVKERGKI